MTLRLSVHAAWRTRVRSQAAAIDGLIPVVKGNGYGFGRGVLATIAAELGPRAAIGTVYEAAALRAEAAAAGGAAPHELTVLTPHLQSLPHDLDASSTVLTVSSVNDVRALADHGWGGRVSIKLRSSMRRYGAEPDELAEVITAAAAAGFAVGGCALHLPLVASAATRAAEIAMWIPHIDPALPVSLSHLDPHEFDQLRAAHGRHRLQLRVGTALWHGDRSQLHLAADVVDVRAVRAGDAVGYRAEPAPDDGWIVLVGAGSTHGVAPLNDGRSPFHFQRHRLSMAEPPHMHTTMLFVSGATPCPTRGDWLDVQRPLTMSHVDELVWLDD